MSAPGSWRCARGERRTEARHGEETAAVQDQQDLRDRRTRASADYNHELAPREREQAAKERAQVVAEMELWAGTPPSPVVSRDRLDADVPDLEDEQMHTLLGGGPPVTPQTAEDWL
ncbi:hypothetical protein NDU88_003742 [Pleurodeles waltl]|uniref:Uncharacterized protein n=1 Tax=Pleurodeles waltl TaxID=8319 RepID=A0AAV7UDF3_PLEWA|nr:hypothetical protein NDU88_003742 [Pleurodeles waltl]